MVKLTHIAALSLVFLTSPAWAQNTTELPDTAPLQDIYLGSPNAPVLIEEYASMTCTHCADFSTEVFPELKEKYIDTGKVRFVMKPFPLDPIAAGAFVLARCEADENFYPIVETLFEHQADWAFVEDKRAGLIATLEPFGFDGEKFDTCLDNPAAVHWIVATQDHAVTEIRLESTPTFLVNGEKHAGNMDIEAFSAILDPLTE